MRYILWLIFFLPILIQARPVSYPESWTVMQQNNVDENRLHLHYSSNAFNSYGLVLHRFSSFDEDVYGLSAQWNHLMYRKNTRYSQANLYLKVNIGIADEFEDRVFSKLTLSGDWETRRWFTAYEVTGFWAEQALEFSQAARLGVAPYVAEYGSLHTWLMLQVDHRPEANDSVLLTSLIRFFKGDYLTELGVNQNGDLLFNWIIRF